MNGGSLCRGALIVAVAVISQSAHADETRAQQADRLFTEANKLANAGDFAAACPRYEQSNQLDPAIGTEFNLADCLEHVGRTASALALFRNVEAIAKTAGKVEREKSARARADALEAKVPRLRIVLASQAEVVGLQVACDGKPIERKELDAGVALDPGRHTVSARAPGRVPWAGAVDLGASGIATVTVPALASESPSPAFQEHAEALAMPSPGRGQRTLAVVAGGVGLVGVGVGTVFGILAFTNHDKASSACPNYACTSQSGVDEWHAAVTAGTIANVGFVVGGVGLAGAAILWLTAPKGAARSARVEVVPGAGASWAGVGVRGKF